MKVRCRISDGELNKLGLAKVNRRDLERPRRQMGRQIKRQKDIRLKRRVGAARKEPRERLMLLFLTVMSFN